MQEYSALTLRTNKIPSPAIFLEHLSNDCTVLRDGIDTKHGTIPVNIGPFKCDAPMRSYLKQIAGHGACNSCDRCVQSEEFPRRTCGQ